MGERVNIPSWRDGTVREAEVLEALRAKNDARNSRWDVEHSEPLAAICNDCHLGYLWVAEGKAKRCLSCGGRIVPVSK